MYRRITLLQIYKYVLSNFWLIKITQFLLSLWQFLTGGDPFPGVYMRDIPALLRNGFRMSRPKFVSATLWVAVIVKQVVRVVQTATPVMLNFSVPPPPPPSPSIAFQLRAEAGIIILVTNTERDATVTFVLAFQSCHNGQKSYNEHQLKGKYHSLLLKRLYSKYLMFIIFWETTMIFVYVGQNKQTFYCFALV